MIMNSSSASPCCGRLIAILLTVCACLAACCSASAAECDAQQQQPEAGQGRSEAAAESEPADDPKPEPLTPEAEQAAEELKAQLAGDSEARAMLDDILNGSRLGPGEGWFAAADSGSQFGWDYVVRTYDGNGDGVVSADEFSGEAADFARIDRNADQELTEADFDWSQHSLTMTPGVMLFFEADRDANGKVTQQELVDYFLSLDSEGHGYLSLDELRDELQPPDEAAVARRRARRSDRPGRSTLILGLQRQEIGSLQSGPSVGELAPDFELTTIEGTPVRLSEQVGDQPVVLIFGNFTCGPFRSQAGNIEKLYERYQHRARIFLVYVREAHPADGWWMNSKKRVGIDVTQPTSDSARRDVAQMCRSHLELDVPFLVDTVDDRVGAAYSGMPNRLYLIDRDGRIVFKNGRGPFGFHPRQLEQALVLLMNDPDSGTADRDR